MKDIPVNFIISILSLPFLIWLQIFLSRQKNKILGLFLPLLSFLLISITRIMNILSFGMNKGGFLKHLVPMIIIVNIPTIIFITIYIMCRKKVRINKEIEKMNIQDLD